MAEDQGWQENETGGISIPANPLNGEMPISANRVRELMEELKGILTEMSHGIRLYETDENDFPVTDERAVSHFLVRSVFKELGNETVFKIVEDNFFTDLTIDFNTVDDQGNLDYCEYLSPVEHYQKYREGYDKN